MAIQAQTIVSIFKDNSSLAPFIKHFLVEMPIVRAMDGPTVPAVWSCFHLFSFLFFFLLLSLLLLTTHHNKRTLIIP